MSACLFCTRPTSQGHNYCGWDCHVSHAKVLGGKTLCPNGLPVRCIRHDNLMMEHGHADHPTYMFPVDVEYVGHDFETEEAQLAIYGKLLSKEDLLQSRDETHALIYTDGCVALTLHEHCYAMWFLNDGTLAGGSLWKRGEWKLSQESLDKITERVK